MLSSSDLVYFELSWSILSTIGIANVLFGFLVCSIVRLSQISAVPLIKSAGGPSRTGCAIMHSTPKGTPSRARP
ncbi:hypothetical protein FOFC_18209 [Fusarium oxysporum]|nr:hypothetical protein FOFC_18209 [Fusarium oxysporum]